MARQRLTNLTFLSAGLLSVLTVSLTMSGTFGEGAAPGCPARVRTGVALDEDDRRQRHRERRAADAVDGKARWWETTKARGRFLEDPVVATPPTVVAAAARSPPNRLPAATGAPGSPRVSPRQGAAPDPDDYRPEPEAVSYELGNRLRGTASGWRSGWKGEQEPEERVV